MNPEGLAEGKPTCFNELYWLRRARKLGSFVFVFAKHVGFILINLEKIKLLFKFTLILKRSKLAFFSIRPAA